MKKNKAFTLLEVLLITIMLAAILFPMLQMLSSGLLVSNELRGSNGAVIIAQRKLEELKNTIYINISSEVKAEVTGYPAFQRQVIVSEPHTNLKDVQVVVFWSPGDGNETSISIETYISNF
jgi:Tfp pilus assembly protein PilV